MSRLNINYYLTEVKEHYYIYISVVWQRQRIRKPLNFIIDKKEIWDKKKQRFKSSYMFSSEMNLKLASVSEELTKFYNQRIANNKAAIQKYEIEEAINKIIKPPKEQKAASFLDYFNDFINDSRNGERLTEKGKKIQENTIKTYITTFNHLKFFSEKYKYDLQFNTINSHFFSLFLKYCTEKKITNNSIGRLVKIIKSFMHYTKNKKIHDNDDFVKALIVFNEDTDLLALSDIEIKQIEDLKDISDRLSKTRDLFLFQVYTGLRISDLTILKPENYNLTKKVITLTTIKTQDKITIPIEDKVIEILNKYNLILPKYSPQKYNEAIKDLAKIAKIDKPTQTIKFIGNERVEETKPRYLLISSHTARRTLITNLVFKGVAPEIIMKITGHKTRKSFEKYIRITESDAIDKVREALKSN